MRLLKEIAKVSDPLERQVLTAFLKFNTFVRKTNFYQPLKAAVSFRFDPKFLADLEFPDVPYGIFLLLGRDFKGFHCRFRDIARGGVRLIRSANEHVYELNSQTLFNECYGLSYTQQKKNKDIPEGGSKGNFLLAPQYSGNPLTCFKQYIDAFLDILLPNPYVKDGLGVPEIIFFGPDEGTAEYMDWAALHSKSRGYATWKSLTTGKAPFIGGIPHDIYGMTTQSTHRAVVEILKQLNWKEEECTKFQTGGPDGDLGSNEILMSKDKTVGVVDGAGVVFDPVGLDRAELTRLAKKRAMVNEFDEKKLGPKGFKVVLSDVNKKLPHGEVVEDGTAFRNTFHLHPLVNTDIFVPCGGRPEAINIRNVHQLIGKDGALKFKVIVEGANLFITEEARLILEKAGVILIKDATANKGGVTSSSHEVLAGLAFSDAEHQEHMCKNGDTLPPFYLEFVKEVQQRIQDNAKHEFDYIWEVNKSKGIPRTLLTNILSDKINYIDDKIRESKMFENPVLYTKVMTAALPKTLLNKLGLEVIKQRVPKAYQQAIFSNYLASRYVYQSGSEANEVGFFLFMEKFL